MRKTFKIQANGYPSTEMGSGHRTLLLTKKLFAVHVHWQMETSVCSNGVSLGITITTGQAPSPGVVG